jgi:hypothetical protein
MGFNNMWIWVNPTPSADHSTFFTGHMTMGYGFWAFAWAIAAYTVSQSRETHVRRLFARLAGVAYGLWWILWMESLRNQTWRWYVGILYGLVRGMQLVGYNYYGFLADPWVVSSSRSSMDY